MSARIKKERGGGVSIALDPFEAAIIRHAFAELIELLDDRAAPPIAAVEIAPGVLDPFADEATANRIPPEDPALARLLPDAYSDDPEANADFRRFTESDLVAGKQAHIRTLLASLDDVGLTHGSRIRLDQAATRAWMYALNDLRLALGTRLAIDDGYEERVAELGEDDPALPHFALYEWLTGLQDALVQTQM